MSNPSKTQEQKTRQAARLGRELLASLKGSPAKIARAAKGADEESWQAALRGAASMPHALEIIKALLAERDVSGQSDQSALFGLAKKVIERRDPEALFLLLPHVQPSMIPYGELIKLAMTHSSPKDGWFDALKTRAEQKDLDGALFFIGQNGLIRGDQLAWAQTVIDAGADPWFMKSVALGSAIGWDNWELADFLAPLSDPRRVAQLIDRAPDNEMPAARAFLEKIELQQSVAAPEPSQRARPRV